MPVDDRSSRRRLGQRAPMQADPHTRLTAESPYHNRNPSPARAPTVASYEESPTVSNNAPLLAPRPQPLAVAIREPPMLVKQSSSGGSSSGGSSIQAHQAQGRGRKRPSIPPPQPIPVPGAPDYSPLPQAQRTHNGAMTSNGSSAASYLGPSQQFAPSPHHTFSHPSQMYSQLYSPAPLPPSANVHGSGNPSPEREFGNPSHFRYRPKVLSVPMPLAPQVEGNGQTAPSNTGVMSPPYQAQRPAAALPEFYSPAAGGAAAVPPSLRPSANPYQNHWQPFTPELPPPSQLQQQQQHLYTQARQLPSSPQQGWQSGHQYSRSESRLIAFPSPPEEPYPLPGTHGGYDMDAQRSNMERQVNPQSAVPGPVQATLSPPIQRGHTKSLSDFGPAKMNASTIARMLQAQKGNPANASSTSLNKFPSNASSTNLNNLPANASSTSLSQQAQAQSQPFVPEVRTNTRRSESPVRFGLPADQAQGPPAPPYTQAQPSSQSRVLRETPPPQAASAPILIRSDSPARPGRFPDQAHSRGYASSEALLESNNNSDNSSHSNYSPNTGSRTPGGGRKISFDVPHGPEQDPPAVAAAPKKKRRGRGRPTNPEDNMFVDPFGFTVTENTPYDVIDKLTAGVSICSLFSLTFLGQGWRTDMWFADDEGSSG